MRTQLRWLCLALLACTALALAGGSTAAHGRRGRGVSRQRHDPPRRRPRRGRHDRLPGPLRGGTDLLHRVAPVYAAGDWRTDASRGDILASSYVGDSYYTRVLPRSESGVACACLLETWISLRGSAASVRHRLTGPTAGGRAGHRSAAAPGAADGRHGVPAVRVRRQPPLHGHAFPPARRGRVLCAGALGRARRPGRPRRRPVCARADPLRRDLRHGRGHRPRRAERLPGRDFA